MNRKAVRRSALVGVVDQGVASVSNFLLIAVVARWSNVAELGILAVLVGVWRFILGVARSIGGQAMAIRSEARLIHRYVSVALTIGLLGLALSLLTALALTFLGSPGAWAILALGATLPGLLIQDLVRWHGITLSKETSSLLNDLVFLTLQIMLMAVLVILDAVNAWTALLTWGLAGTVAGGLGLRRRGVSRVAVEFCEVAGSLRRERWLTLDFIADFTLFQSYLLLGGVFAAVEHVGATATIATLYGPANVALLGLASISAAKAGAARTRGDTKEAFRVTRVLAAMGLAVVTVVGVAYVLLGESLIRTLFGQSLAPYTPLLGVMGLEVASRALHLAPQIRLHTLGSSRWLFRAKVFATPIALLVGIPILVSGDDLSVGWAAFSMTAVATAATWFAYASRSRTAFDG